MRVPVYGERQVSLRPDLQQGINVRASASAFGADIGAGLQQVGRGLGEASDAMARLQDFQGALEAKDALTGFERDKMQLEYGQNGYLTTQGANAAGGYQKYTDDLEELKRKHGAKLTGAAAQKYDDAANVVVTNGMRTGIVHSAQGTKDWAASSSTARLATLGEQALAAYARPQDVQRNIALGFEEINEQGRMIGWGQDVLDLKKREFASGVHANVALAMASQPNGAGAAIGYLNKNAGLMDTKTRMDLETKLKPYADEEAAMTVVNGLMASQRSGPSGEDGVVDPARGRDIGATGPSSVRADLLARAQAAGKGADHVDGLTEDFATNLSAMFQDAPPEFRGGLQIGSGVRTIQRQEELFKDALKRYGSVAEARRHVAPAGKSRHNFGQAVDIWYNGQSLGKAPADVQAWVHSNAGKYGLRFPMSYEPWHIEPEGARSGGNSAAAAGGSTVVPSGPGVSARAGMPSYDDAMSTIMAISDPGVREAALRQFNAQVEVRSKAERAAVETAKNDMWAMVASGTTVADIPLDLKIAAGREAVTGFMDYESKISGGDVKTDPATYQDLTVMAAKNPEGFANTDMTAPEIINNLSPSDLKSMMDKKAGILSGDRAEREKALDISSAMSFAKTQLEGVGITTTGLDGKARTEMAAREAEFQMVLAKEMEYWHYQNNGKRISQAEIMSITNRLLLPAVIKTPRSILSFLDPVEEQSFLFEQQSISDTQTFELNVQYDDIAADVRRGIAHDLQKKLGRIPTEEEIVEQYELFKSSSQP